VTSQRNIAWIGAGKMGLPICKRLKAAGHEVKVLARRPAQGQALAALGFTSAESVAETVRSADVVFTSVTDDNALSDVALNPAFATALKAGAVFIDISTVSPAISAQIAAQLPKSIAFLRSPVSGSTGMAETGTLTALVSGPKQAFVDMTDIFAAFTKKAFHLGGGEEARFLKLAINSMVAATSALLGEALAFGAKSGLTHASMLEVIAQSAVASPLIGYKKDMIISGDYKAAATLNMLKKDLDLLISTANAQQIALPVNSMIRDIYAAAAEQGLGERKKPQAQKQIMSPDFDARWMD
jgi:3-hydroxyisobutyrate dehydrogenase-like beta-hydroxyacid dehydrogenase